MNKTRKHKRTLSERFDAIAFTLEAYAILEGLNVSTDTAEEYYMWTPEEWMEYELKHDEDE